jgi:hypothetical protein
MKIRFFRVPGMPMLSVLPMLPMLPMMADPVFHSC